MANTKRDYYEVLGIERSASKQDIAAAYRKLALKFHPDRNPGDESAVEKFKEASEAFDVLNNDDKRAAYDRYGHQGVDGMPGGGPQFRDMNDIFEAFGGMGGGFADIFGDIFGGGAGGRRSRGGRPPRGEDIRCVVDLDLREVAKGIKKKIKIRRKEVCTVCSGSGAKPGTAPEPCSYCNGRGVVTQGAGFIRMQTTCPSCHGTGKVIRTPCTACRGAGLYDETIEIDVDIPAGIDERNQLRIVGEGSRSPKGGEPGDCYLNVRFKEHPVFQVDGKDLICKMPITYSQAALGATLDVPLLDGHQDFKLPAGTQNGDIFRLKGKGLPQLNRPERCGDILLVMTIEVPRTITAEQEKLLRKLAELEQVNVSSQRKGFFKRIKDYLQTVASEIEGAEAAKDKENEKEQK